MNTLTPHTESSEKNIFDTIKFIWLNWSETFVQELKTIELNPSLKNCTIALAESTPRHDKFQWLYDALNILRKNPDEKIVLMSFISVQLFLSKNLNLHKEAFELFQSYPNTRFKELPFAPDELNTLYVEEESISETENQITNQRQVETRELLIITHWGSDQLWSRRNQPETWTQEEKANVEKTISRCKQHYPSMKNDTDVEILQFVEDMKRNLDLVAKWQHFEWVFCDIDGTLIVNDTINHGAIDLLEQYHKHWKSIIIWTGWDLQEQQQKLEELWIVKLLAENNIPYKLVSKYDYAGASVEIAIDDFDQNRLIVNNAIKSQTHIDPARFMSEDHKDTINILKQQR